LSIDFEDFAGLKDGFLFVDDGSFSSKGFDLDVTQVQDTSDDSEYGFLFSGSEAHDFKSLDGVSELLSVIEGLDGVSRALHEEVVVLWLGKKELLL